MDSQKYLKIKEFAKLTGLSEQCLRNWDDNGLLKCHHRSEKGGYRYYTQEQVDAYLDKAKRQIKVIGYCRSTKELEEDNKRQKSVLRNYVSTRDIDLDDFVIVSDVCDGVTNSGSGILSIISDISDSLVKELIVEDKTRLSTVSFNIIQLVAKAHGCKVTVLNGKSKLGVKDAVTDCVELMHLLIDRLDLTKDEIKSMLCDIVDNI